ncbi:hypothetical protein HPP92_028692 [Vanilla planifolia]|uniref:Uncharacterized protein n=1 Tax=Vanilla planifolia TaxID=51239 RepID=A0A835U3T9_VANPL|nr:hypothetical protein HPP92_028692 [Vanilla planifolia]KAG0446770.1 hypothetical protein HPP92_028678 [Vanilla planifolia]
MAGGGEEAPVLRKENNDFEDNKSDDEVGFYQIETQIGGFRTDTFSRVLTSDRATVIDWIWG